MALLDIIVVATAVLLAFGYLLLRARRAWRGSNDCSGCAGCSASGSSSCPTKQTEQLVQLRIPGKERRP